MPWWDIFTLDRCELRSVLNGMASDSLCRQRKRKPELRRQWRLRRQRCLHRQCRPRSMVLHIEAVESGKDRAGMEKEEAADCQRHSRDQNLTD
jgi:hypothetical protein